MAIIWKTFRVIYAGIIVASNWMSFIFDNYNFKSFQNWLLSILEAFCYLEQ